MERFVIGAAVAVAVLIAAGSMFGQDFRDEGGFAFQFGDRDDGGAAKGDGVESRTPSTAYAATEVRIRDAVAVVKIIPEDRADVAYEMTNSGVLVSPTVKLERGVLVIDGNLRRKVRDCSAEENWSVKVGGVGDVAEAQMPVITVRTPRHVELSVGGAVKTDVGAAGSAEISLAGCGPTTIADIAGELEVSIAGSGDVKTGAAATATISAAGSGDVALGAIAGKFEASVAGSGSVAAAAVTGPLDVSIAGSGDVSVNGGAVTDADISIAGSGNVAVASTVGRLKTSIMGSGDVTVRGAAGSVDASIMGSGDVRVTSVSGGVQKSIMGAGSVEIGPIEAE